MKFDICGFENLHVHTTIGSVLDGYSQPEELAKRAKETNQKFLCITDHGSLGAIPKQIYVADKNKLNPLFGVELYINPYQPEIGKDCKSMKDFTAEFSEADQKALRKSYHLLAIAYNQVGYKNLVNMSSWGWTKGFYYKPRINHKVLQEHKEGIIFTSCCYNSEIGQAFDAGGEEAGFAMLEKYLKMLGKNNYYLELMLLDFAKQKPYDAFILKCKDRYNLPIIITNDCHYPNPEDSQIQRLMLMVQTGRTLGQLKAAAAASGEMTDFFELQDTNLWLKSEDELNSKWLSDYKDIIPLEIFEEAKATTVKVAEYAKGVQLDRTIKLPQIPEANQILKEEVAKGFKRRNLPMSGPKGVEYIKRIEEELYLITKKEFSSYFLIKKSFTDEARRKCKELFGGTGHDAVGPGRGSGSGSLVLYCLGITDVDPIEHDLLFSRFLSPARGGKLMKLRFTIDPEVEECPFDV